MAKTNIYYKNRYTIAFYKQTREKDNEYLYATFNNVEEILKYKNLPQDKLYVLKVELCNALKKESHITRMLNGETMTVHLIDMLEEQLEQERRDKCMTLKRFVKITSTITIEVYCNLESVEIVNANKQSSNRFSSVGAWANVRVRIMSGTGWYPSEILNWNAVKALAAKEILTIGEQVNEIKDADKQAAAEEMEKMILKGKKRLEQEKTKLEKQQEELKKEN